MMTAKALYSLLRGLEGRMPTPAAPPAFTSAPCVRDNHKRSQIQLFGFDQPKFWKQSPGDGILDSEQPLPVIVTVGGNYTQDKQDVPRDHHPSPPEVLDDLTACRKHLEAGLTEYRKDKPLWVRECAASPVPFSNPFKQYHLVMTNFCAWITVDSWQNIAPHCRANLLQNNPPFTGVSPTDRWPHLAALAKRLARHDTLWIGHGIDCEVFALFRQFVADQEAQQWLLLPNLGRPYHRYTTHFPRT